MVLNLKKLESPSPKDAFCQVWLKLAQWFWRRRFLQFVNVFFAISLLSPYGKGSGPLFEQILIIPRRTTQGCFVQSLVEIDSVVFEKKMKMRKVYRQTYRRTDDTQQTIRKDHLSFQVRWAKTELLLLYMVKSCHKKKGSTSTECFSRVNVDECYLYM